MIERRDNPREIFITGTDTNVGKTYVGAAIARELVAQGKRVGVYKPAASGCEERDGVLVSDDALMLWEAAGRPGELERVCPQRFRAPLAPHLAAKAEGKTLDRELLRTGADYWRERRDVLLVEGAGGLMSPISDDDLVADLARDFGFPLVIVAANRIGVINQVLQTLLVAGHFSLNVQEVILNDVVDPRSQDDPSREGNERELRRLRPELAIRVLNFGQ